MDPSLARALAPVLADIEATGAPVPLIRESAWTNDRKSPSAMLWASDGSGQGVHISLRWSDLERTIEVADQVQEWVIEERWARGSNWPQCPRHPLTHPARPREAAGVAAWVCPADGALIARIGELPA